MATGDMSNNIRKLTGKLKAVQYTDGLDVKALAEGSPTVYLPIYHHMFTSYSPALAEKILAKDIEMYSKSDARFMEAVYKVLRDLFSYKPPITKEQFFSKGFCERKVIMCTDIVQLIRDKYPVSKKTALKTSVRPKSSVDTAAYTSTGSSYMRPSSAANSSPRDADGGAMPSVPQVVNELKTAPSSAPVRHVAYSVPHTNLVRHTAVHSGQSSALDDESQPRSLPNHLAQYKSCSQPAKRVTIVTPRTEEEVRRRQDRERRLQQPGSPEGATPLPLDVNTPSISRVCHNSVEVVNMPRNNEDESIVEIRAPTSDSVLQDPVPVSSPEVNTQISRLQQTIKTLTQHVLTFDEALKSIQSGASTDGYIRQLEERIQGQINNLMARMVLVENRVSIMEAKVEDCSRTLNSSGHSNLMTAHPPPPVTMVARPDPPGSIPMMSHGADSTVSSFAEELAQLSSGHPLGHHRVSALSNGSGDASLDYSPIRKVTNGTMGQLLSANEDTFAMETEDDARRSSTPTSLQESSLWINFSNTDTNDAAIRIKQMMKETKSMLSRKAESAETNGGS